MNILNRSSQFLSHFGSRNFAEKSAIKPIKMAFTSFGDINNKEIQKNSPLLVMHGFFGSKQNWRSLGRFCQPLTNPLRRIITVDARNHGDSPRSNVHTTAAMAEDVRLLLENEKIKQIIFLGQSMGGLVAMHFAMQYPDLTERLIIVDSSPMPHIPGLKRHLEHIRHITNLSKIPPGTKLSTARSKITKELAKQVPSKRVLRYLVQNIKVEPDGTISWKFNVSPIKEHLETLIKNSSFIEAEVKKLQSNFENLIQYSVNVETGFRFLGPTLFIKGGRSNYMKKEDYGNIKTLFPQAVIEEVPNAGHWVHYEKQLDFMKYVLEFINDPAPPREDSYDDFAVS